LRTTSGIGVAVGLAPRLHLLAHALLLAGQGLADRLGVALVLLGLGHALFGVEGAHGVAQPDLVPGRDGPVTRRAEHLHEARALAQPRFGILHGFEFGHLRVTRADIADLELYRHRASEAPLR
jgi:hypothetical protein